MADAPKTRTAIFPAIEPYDTGMLKVSDLHTVYYEQVGKADGKPVIFLHGGPGAGCEPSDRCFFDPTVYRIILMDQRGAGHSTPPAELRENNTWTVVEDIERLRRHLGIDKWVVFGGSWGSALSLAYSETHPGRVKALILRGVFTLRRQELIWFYQKGASHVFPDFWEDYLAPIPEVERYDLMSAYYRRLTGSDPEEQLRCARSWSNWEMRSSRLIMSEDDLKMTDSDQWALQFARLECHYFVYGGFFKSDGQLLDEVDKIRHIPCTIVQGRYDMACPAETAWKLYKNFPEAEFYFVDDAGHSEKEKGITALLVAATEKYKSL